jgi:pyoverdine/dityrosine biosynthesis protein Dit1
MHFPGNSPPIPPLDWRPGPNAEEIVGRIVDLLYEHRRALEPGQPGIEAWLHPEHRRRVSAFVRAGEPVHFVLPAFPAKSANPLKVVGDRPDVGELLSLRFLDDLCAQIARHHRPGARLTICSDGRVFSDLVGVSDEAVTRYRADLLTLIERHRLGHLDLIDLDHLYPRQSYDAVRDALVARHGQALPELRTELLASTAGVGLLNGIHRFLLEDLAAARPELSRSRARALTREQAYRTIQRSNAWSRAVAERFPAAVRLSIHPQLPGSPKLGIVLLPAADVWRTPWHGVVLDTGTEFRLVRRVDAARSGARLVTLDGRPAYFVAAAARAQELPA